MKNDYVIAISEKCSNALVIVNPNKRRLEVFNVDHMTL